MTKIERVEKYIADFFADRFDDFNWFVRSTHENRRHGIYLLKRGAELMDFCHSIQSNIEEQLISDQLVPKKFATPEKLFFMLEHFKVFLEEHQDLLDINMCGKDTDYAISKLLQMKNDLIAMIDHVTMMYDRDDVMIPYQELRACLIGRDIPEFIAILRSLMAGLPYAIAKIQEGFFHSNLHIILKLLGFEIISEEITNTGRIDAVIRFLNIIYILEIKFGKNEDLSTQALQQIKDNKYPEKFHIERKDIIGIGISFGEEDRNINGFQFEKF